MADQSEESLVERQEEEVEVLKAIYDCDFQDLRKSDVWKVRRPPEFLLKIRPDHDSRGPNQQACTVDLRIKCSDKYPLVPPEIDLINAKCVSDLDIASLKNELEKMSKSAVGEVMVMNLAQHVSRFVSFIFQIEDFHGLGNLIGS